MSNIHAIRIFLIGVSNLQPTPKLGPQAFVNIVDSVQVTWVLAKATSRPETRARQAKKPSAGPGASLIRTVSRCQAGKPKPRARPGPRPTLMA